jgi:hypothetical protein
MTATAMLITVSPRMAQKRLSEIFGLRTLAITSPKMITPMANFTPILA